MCGATALLLHCTKRSHSGTVQLKSSDGVRPGIAANFVDRYFSQAEPSHAILQEDSDFRLLEPCKNGKAKCSKEDMKGFVQEIVGGGWPFLKGGILTLFTVGGHSSLQPFLGLNGRTHSAGKTIAAVFLPRSFLFHVLLAFSPSPSAQTARGLVRWLELIVAATIC